MDLRALMDSSGAGTEEAIAQAIQRRMAAQMMARQNDIATNRLPGGVNLMQPQYQEDYNLLNATRMLGQKPDASLLLNKKKKLSPKAARELSQFEGLFDRYQTAPQVSPTLRRLMAQRGLLTPEGVTPEGEAFIRSLSTGEYGLPY